MFVISDLVRHGYMRDDIAMPSYSLNNDIPTEKVNVKTEPEDLTFSDPKEEPSELSPTPKDNKLTKKDNKDKYKCVFEGCNATFPRPWRLKNHLQVHNGEKTYKCMEEGCNKAYTSNSHLIRHVAQTHKKSNEHRQSFMCEVSGCGKNLKNRATLVKHMQRLHSERNFECSVCNVKFRTEEQLSSHSKNHHKCQTSHRCDRCKLIFLKLRHYNRHMRKHRMHICYVPSCVFVTDNYTLLRRHIGAKHPKVFQCDSCGKETNNKSNLKKHILVHLIQEGLVEPVQQKESPVKFTCPRCYLDLTTKASLQRHVKLIHEKPADLRTERIVKCKPERAIRKDKNLPKQCLASKLSSVKVPLDIEKTILKKETYSADDHTSRKIYELMIQDLQRTIELPLGISDT